MAENLALCQRQLKTQLEDTASKQQTDQEKSIDLLAELNALDVTRALRHMNRLELEKKEKYEELEECRTIFRMLGKHLPRQSSPSDVIG